MPDTTPTPKAMEDLTKAISTLLPAIASLEARLQATDEEALKRERELAEALDRIATELDTLVRQQASLLKVLPQQATASAHLVQEMKTFDQQLQADAEKRVTLEKAVMELVQLLRGTA